MILVAAASAVGAAIAQAQPTAATVSDVAAALCLGAVVVFASARADPRAWLVASVVAAAASRGHWVAVGGTAAVLAAFAIASPDRAKRPLIGALIGAGVVQAMLRLPPARFGTNVVLSIAALGCLVVAGWSGLTDSTRARLRRPMLVLGALVGLCVAGLLLSIVLARADVADGVSGARHGLNAARKGEGDKAAVLLEGAAQAFDAAHGNLDAWWAKPSHLVPVVGQQARALEVLTDQGSELADAAATSVRTARLEDLRVVDGRLDLDQVTSMAAPLTTVQAALVRADRAIDRARSPWLIPPVANGFGDFERSLAAAQSDAATASTAVEVLPGLLGGNGRRTYFVAFGTPAETRELGGFMGAYALVRAEKGKLTLAGTGRVRNLNRYFQGKQLSDPTAFPDHYLAQLPQRFWHNMTGTPDFPTVAEAVHQLWRRPRGGSVDGVVYMDPATLADLLDLTGPIQVPDYDEPLTADTAADFLLRDQYIAFPDDDRHDFLVDTAKTVFEKLTSGELPEPRLVAETLAPAVSERRLLLHSFHPDEQALFERVDLDGALPPVDGDFLSVRASNRGLNKLDAMMHRTVDDHVVVDPERDTVRSTVTVTIKNDAPGSGLPYGVIGNRLGQPDGTNSTTVAVYTPLDLVDITQDGRSIGRGATSAHGRNRYIALIDVPPLSEVTVVFELQGSVDLRRGYHLDVVPQPMVNPDELRVTVEGAGAWRPWGHRSLESELRDPVELRVPFVPSI